MTKYNELSLSYEAQDQANIEYWQALQLQAARITSGFANYLGISQKKYQEPNGRSLSYIQLRVSGGEEEVSFNQLTGAASAIHFDIGVTLERAPGVFPKAVIRVPLKIGRSDSELVIWSDEAPIRVRIPVESTSYEPLYDQIFDQLKLHLSTRPSLSTAS